MVKPAFSTVASPEWTLAEVAAAASGAGFESVELRTFGPDSRDFACDPSMSSEDKTRGLFADRGVEIASLATSVRFDAQVFPPVVGNVVGDQELCLRQARRAVDLAARLECPVVRVFGFEPSPREKRSVAVERIASRIAAAADHARNTGVRIAVENGGAFGTGASLGTLIDAARGSAGTRGGDLIGACYNVAVAHASGESPNTGVAALGDRLLIARVKDHEHGSACALGAGKVPCKDLVETLVLTGFDGPVVFEWDRAWDPDLAPADLVLRDACKTLFSWIAEAQSRRRGGIGSARVQV